MSNHGKNSSTYPHFFRVILPHHLRIGTLELPVNFVTKHGTSLCKYGHLKLPTGAVSRMEVKTDNNRAWIHKGWLDFVEKCSIKPGYFLLFSYQGGSRFNVQIFDPTTCEIQYPPLIKEEEEALNQDASSCFTTVMRTTHVGYNYTLHIPDAHSRSYIRKQNVKEVRLVRGDDQEATWVVKVYAWNYKKARFSSGWKGFVVDNSLQLGDSCKFELLSQKPNCYRVTIFRGDETTILD